MPATFETQIFPKDGSWFMTITICVLGSQWTSPDTMLDAETEDEARHEAAANLALLKRALRSPDG